MPDAAAPFTVKSFPIDARKMAVDCAGRRGETMAVWLERAVLAQANLEANDKVYPPGKPGKPDTGTGESEETTFTPPPFDLAGFAAAVSATIAAMHAANLTPSSAFARDVAATVRCVAREARGLPPLRPRQTRPVLGQTLSLDHQV